MSAVPLAASRAWVSPPRAHLRASPRARLAAARAAPLRVSLAHPRAGPAAFRPPRLPAVVVRASSAAASEPDPALRAADDELRLADRRPPLGAEDVLLHLLGLAPPRDANANDDASDSPSPSSASASASAADRSPTSPPASSSPSSSARERWLPAPLVAFSRMSLLFFLAALFFATAHLVGAGASLAASLTASITPVVFLANGAAVTNAAAAVSGGLNAWAANAASVAVTAVASGASGAVGYSVAAARARAEMAALRAELEELRRVVGETAGAIETRMNERRSERTAEASNVPEGQQAEETTIGVTIATGKIESGGESSSLEEVDWAALAKSRAVWSPPGRDEPEARASAHASPDDVPFSAAVAAPAGPAETPRARVPPSDPADVDAARRAALAAELEELRARLARVRAVDAADADADADDAAASLRFGDDERSASNALSKEEASSASSSASSASSRERADAAEALAALRAELAELRRAKSSEASDDAAPTDGAAGAAADVVDWAALAKSRAVWSPPEGRGGGGAGARTAEGSRDEDGSAEAASEAAAEAAAARAGADALDAEDAEWRRRLREGASKPKPRGGEEA